MTLEDQIKQHPFGRDLEPAHVRALSACGKRLSVPAGGVIWRQGESRTVCSLLQDGQLVLEIRLPSLGIVTVDTVRAGGVLGWSALFDNNQWRYDARALTPAEMIVLDAQALREHCDQDHELGYQLLRRCLPILATQLEGARAKLIDLLGA